MELIGCERNLEPSRPGESERVINIRVDRITVQRLDLLAMKERSWILAKTNRATVFDDGIGRY
jgi:hypothetical protein